jgi:hypothetical protein
MRWASLILTLAAVIVSPARATDLAKARRPPTREPAYRTKAPKYCLLAFGPEAKSRVWLVLDGDTLYVDRNGNGDLTEKGKKVVPEGAGGKAPEGYLTFEAGAVRDGKRTHKDLRLSVLPLGPYAENNPEVKDYVTRNPKACGYLLAVGVDMPGWSGTGVGGRVMHYVAMNDAAGFLKFADRPEDAPVIHLGGPWQVTLCEKAKLRVGRDTDLYLGVGTPGLGAGTTAFVAYDGLIPSDAYPRVEITYPPRRKGETPVKELYELKGRC